MFPDDGDMFRTAACTDGNGGFVHSRLQLAQLRRQSLTATQSERSQLHGLHVRYSGGTATQVLKTTRRLPLADGLRVQRPKFMPSQTTS